MVERKKKKAEEARRKHEKEMEIARRVQAGENRRNIESELELEDPIEVDDDGIFSKEEEGRVADVPMLRKSAMRADAVGEREAKWTQSPRPSGASPTLSPPTLGAAVQTRQLEVQGMRDVQKHQVEAPALAPRKARKVSTNSTTQWVVEVQAAIQRGAASARADPKESVAQGEATEAATKQAGEEVPMPYEVEARELDEAEAPSVVEATEGKVEAPRTSKAEVAEARAPGTTRVEVAEASLGAAESAAQDAETKTGQASVPPLVQDPPPPQESAREVEVHSISSDDTSWGKEVADAEAASTAKQLALTSGKGSSALVWVQPEPRGCDSSRVLWQSQDDPKGEPLFALKDVAKGGAGTPSSNSTVWRSSHCGQRCPSWLTTCLALPSMEVEDLCLRCADMKAEATMAREQAVPLAARIKELEEELTRVADEWDTFRSWAKQVAASAKAIIGQLGAEQSVHRLTKGALVEAIKVAKASWVEALA
ncbi:uncharacterized protein [Miscanthus floridulus]|uniref:uncharacterized protein n=1 Tax=Miscanthus floridulus TaxID=154761 RepID=UPI0034578E88